jgi:class 3 adenylate cyclase
MEAADPSVRSASGMHAFLFADLRGYTQFAATRGDLGAQNLLGKLAQEFGIAIGSYGALRDAIGDFDEKHQWKPKKPTGDEYRTIMEPHGRGSILVAAVFEGHEAVAADRGHLQPRPRLRLRRVGGARDRTLVPGPAVSSASRRRG